MKEFLEGKPLRHPLHTFLVHFPIGLFVLSFVLDVLGLLFSGIPDVVRASFYAMLAGVVAALLAAVPGLVDYAGIRRDHPAKRTATAHLILNLLMVAVFAVNIGLRTSSLAALQVPTIPFILSLVGIGLLSVSGYLGGTLVYDDGIAVGRHRRHTPAPEETLKFSTSSLAPQPGSPFLFVEIANADRLQEAESLRVQIDQQVMVVIKHDGRFFALQEFCTHRFGPLSEGTLKGGQLQCPWHGSCFELATGKVADGPAKVDLKTFPVEVRNGKICVAIRREPAAQKMAA